MLFTQVFVLLRIVTATNAASPQKVVGVPDSSSIVQAIC